ncbi:hypothetical protein Vafri_12372 [Volvox africanus]|uniref:Smr domain-containing protein n=1 Tax=Volvox africanus TaxID=51714 RepID=A0A8J4F1I4_9CHLO|nr:hypothetical protein Vafri_12372 [Volvox africanus]
MLNVSAKEFIPAASPKPSAATVTAPAKDGSHGEQRAVPVAAADRDRVCASVATGGTQPKPKLSPTAPAFVPRVCGKVAAAAMSSCRTDSAPDTNPPRSVLTPPRSDSTLSSSLPSSDPDSGPQVYGEEEGEEEGHWCGDDQPPTTCVPYHNGGCVNASYCYYYPEIQQQSEQQYNDRGGYGAVQGGELAPGNCVYDQYGYDMYDGYTSMPYISAGMDNLGVPVYYDSTPYTYDEMQQQYDSQYAQGAYFWDEASSSWVYGDTQQYASCGDGGEYASTAAVGCWPSPSSQQPQPERLSSGDGAAAAAAGLDLMTAPLCSSWADDVEASTEAAAGAGADTTDGADLELDLGGGEEFRSLGPSDAAELLEMFFPHYAGGALSRLLLRTGGDLMAAFAELAAMERQVGAERAAAAVASGRRGGKGPGGRSKKSGGGGAAAFELDLEAFPALPPSPCPLAPAKMLAPVATPDPADVAVAGAGQQPEAADVTSNPPGEAAVAEDNSATATITVAATGPAAAPSPSPLRPNFASMVRNSNSATPPYGGCSTSSTAVCNGGGRGGGAAARGPRGFAAASAAAAAVPWVSTGEVVSSQYWAERREASMLARARNQCFQQATMAYLSGNKALAKKLGHRGRELNEAMKAAHAAAARRIFAQRNGRAAPGGYNHHNHHGNGNHSGKHYPQHHAYRRYHQQSHQSPHRHAVGSLSGAAGAGAGEGLFVDLHGLHATEAVTVLEAQIEQARAAGCCILRVCTGTGHHTKGARTPARLPAAVADALLSNHLTFKTLKPGLLEAHL